MQIKTKRLLLKKLQQKDKPALIGEINDWEIAKYLSNLPHPYTDKDAENWLKISNKQRLNFNIFVTERLIGGVKIAKTDDGYHELGYWLGRKHWGYGYMNEAAAALLAYGRQKHNLKKFKAQCIISNEASKRLLIKLGFKVVGECQCYCLARKKTLASIKFVL